MKKKIIVAGHISYDITPINIIQTVKISVNL